jgi:L-lactate dehydrogenase (cytochrome)
MAKCMICQHLRPTILADLIVSPSSNTKSVNATNDLPPVIYKYAGKDGSKTYNEYHSANLIEKSLSPSDKKGDFDTSTITDTWLEAQKEETVSEADPNEKPPLSSIINLDDFEKAFAKSGSQKANAYVSGASNDLITLNANKTFWQRLWFRPRVMRNVSAVNTKMRMLGVDVEMPVWICPMGIAKQAGPEGEAALGRGAKSAGIVHCVSTTASMSVEEIVASGEGNSFFFQLYVDKQRHKTEAVLKQLEGQSIVCHGGLGGSVETRGRREDQDTSVGQRVSERAAVCG